MARLVLTETCDFLLNIAPCCICHACACLRVCIVFVSLESGECHLKRLISRLLLQVLPEAPVELIAELARRYVLLYEKITGKDFQILGFEEDLHSEMAACVQAALKTSGDFDWTASV